MRKINVHDKAGSLEDITREIEINLSGPIRMVKQFLPHLKTKSEAAIMNVSSSVAFVPLPISPVYCATKAGLHSFTESLRVEAFIDEALRQCVRAGYHPAVFRRMRDQHGLIEAI